MKTPPADELVDVIDDDGHTVAVVTRAEMRVRRLPHRCTYILVFNSRGELFIHLRTATKDVFPSHWDVTIGGVLAAGESFDDGARREAREELGIESPSLERLFPYKYSVEPIHGAHAIVYRLCDDGPFQLQSEEIVRGKFVSVCTVFEQANHEPFCPDGLAVFETFYSVR